MQVVSGVELMKVIKKESEEKAGTSEEKTPKISNIQDQKGKKEESRPRKGNGMEEIKEMMKRMEERITKQINEVEEKIDVLMKRMEPQWGIEREGKDPDQSDSPDAKRFQEMLQKASEEMDATLREIDETEDSSGKNKRSETMVGNENQGIRVTQDENEERQNIRGKKDEINKAAA